jgi:hypothetical protein
MRETAIGVPGNGLTFHLLKCAGLKGAKVKVWCPTCQRRVPVLSRLPGGG